MSTVRVFVLSVSVLALVVAGDGLAQEISDPYEVLDRYFEAVGGLDRLQAERAYYFEGALNFAGMEGNLKQWSRQPGQTRAEIALGPLNIIQGDNGEHRWVVDQNGKLQVITNPDEATVKRRQVRRLIEEYAFADRDSDVFTVELEGIEQVDGKDCYVVKITNNINVDSYTNYINTRTFLLEKAVFIEDDESRDAFYSDYRDIQGLQVPFQRKETMHSTGQASEISVTRYESNPEIDAALFEPPEQGAKDYQFVEGDRAEDIPFEFVGDHLFIPVTVEGKERLWVLDTGAGMTVLDISFVEDLALPLEGDMKGQGAGGTVDVSFTTMPPFRVEGIEFQEQTVAVIDMTELTRRIGLDIVGILGFDFLSRFVTKVDYANELVSFYAPETFEYKGNGQILDIHIENSQFEVQATLDGVHTGSWLGDIGAGTTHLDSRYALREGYAGRHGVLRMGHGAGNEFQLKTVKCDSLEFVGFTVYEPPISFSYGGTDTTFAVDQIGVLGNSLFRNFVLYCDYAGERIIVEKGDRFNQPWPRDKSGLQIAWSYDREVEVTYVSPDTPAEKAGFVKGDMIRFINGIDAGLFDGIIAIRELLKADPGTKYEVVVGRAEQGKTLELELAELF
jgi:hypothetical protein